MDTAHVRGNLYVEIPDSYETTPSETEGKIFLPEQRWVSQTLLSLENRKTNSMALAFSTATENPTTAIIALIDTKTWDEGLYILTEMREGRAVGIELGLETLEGISRAITFLIQELKARTR